MSAFHSSLFGNHLAEEGNLVAVLFSYILTLVCLLWFVCLLMSSPVVSIGLSIISECGISCHQGFKRVHAQLN